MVPALVNNNTQKQYNANSLTQQLLLGYPQFSAKFGKNIKYFWIQLSQQDLFTQIIIFFSVQPD